MQTTGVEAVSQHPLLMEVNTMKQINPQRIDEVWNVMSIRELLEIVKQREIVFIADQSLGIPTIHDQPQAEHLGFGVFRAQTAEYAINWQAGSSMNRLVMNGESWTEVLVEWGSFPYDKTQVIETLERWAAELSQAPGSAPVASELVEAIVSEADEELVERKPTKTKRTRKKSTPIGPADLVRGPEVVLPEIWRKPDKFEFHLDDGSIVIAEYDGANGIGFGHGDLQYDFHGPTISVTGFRSVFESFAKMEHYGDPVNAAIAIARELAVKQALEIKKNKKKWPVKYAGDVAVKLELENDHVVRAKPISWNEFNQWWYMWIYDKKEGRMTKPENVVSDLGEAETAAGEIEVVTPTHAAAGTAVRTVAQPKVETTGSHETAPAVKVAPRLPAGVPEVIEIDVGGREPQWVTATVVKVSGPQLICKLDHSGEVRKTKVIGRDIEWRVPEPTVLVLAPSLAATPMPPGG
jgi:hypothetical protein